MPYRLPNPFRHGQPIGRRGFFLLVYGVLQVLLGWGILDTPPAVLKGLHIFRSIPVEVLAVTWIIPGVICLWAAFISPRSGEWGFTAGYLMPALYGSTYFVDGAVYHDVPLGIAARSAAIYLALAALVLVVSGWPEPPLSGKELPRE